MHGGMCSIDILAATTSIGPHYTRGCSAKSPTRAHIITASKTVFCLSTGEKKTEHQHKHSMQSRQWAARHTQYGTFARGPCSSASATNKEAHARSRQASRASSGETLARAPSVVPPAGAAALFGVPDQERALNRRLLLQVVVHRHGQVRVDDNAPCRMLLDAPCWRRVKAAPANIPQRPLRQTAFFKLFRRACMHAKQPRREDPLMLR